MLFYLLRLLFKKLLTIYLVFKQSSLNTGKHFSSFSNLQPTFLANKDKLSKILGNCSREI